MITTLVALVLSLLVQVQGPNVPVATKIQAMQLAVAVINLAQAESVTASSTPVVASTTPSDASTTAPVSQGVPQEDPDATAQDIQQITQIISPPPPAPIIPIAVPCSIEATPSPTPHGNPGENYMAGWDVKIQWDAGDAYRSDKNATFSFDPPVTVQYYKANQIDLYGNGTAVTHQMATSTTYTVTVNVNNVHVLPQTSCSVTVDLTDLINQTGIPLGIVSEAPLSQ